MRSDEFLPETILKNYGIDVRLFPRSSYHINESTEMLIIADRSIIAFEGQFKPKEVIHGTFSDTYFHYFPRIKDEG